jgi:4-aminobutyrate aminotransferase
MTGTFFAPFPYLTHSAFAIDGQYKTWPQPYAFWGAAPMNVVQKEVDRCLDAFEMILRTQTSPSETAAVILEPVLGEGGYVPSPPGFLKGLKAICAKHGILLIADEVQTGFGRTGSMFASDWIDDGVAPDILVCAKGLGNGYPISAIGTRQDLAISQPPGSMGGTYGGNAVACAAASAVLDAFEKEGVLQNTMNMEVLLRQGIAKVAARHPGLIREVRGRGLMIGVEFERGGGVLPSDVVAPGVTAGAIAAACHRQDLVILSCGPYDTLRFIPPLNINKDDLELGIKKFSDAADDYVAKAKDTASSLHARKN